MTAARVRRGMKLPPHAGIVAYRKARTTGTHVGLYRPGSQTVAEEGWATVCEEHGGCIMHETRRAAEGWLSHPDTWCPTCMCHAAPAEPGRVCCECGCDCARCKPPQPVGGCLKLWEQAWEQALVEAGETPALGRLLEALAKKAGA